MKACEIKKVGVDLYGSPCSFQYKTDFKFLLKLITFEPLELKQSYIHHLKVLMCGINASKAQWLDYIFILCYTYLNLALLLFKTVLKNFQMSTTVHSSNEVRNHNFHSCKAAEIFVMISQVILDLVKSVWSFLIIS